MVKIGPKSLRDCYDEESNLGPVAATKAKIIQSDKRHNEVKYIIGQDKLVSLFPFVYRSWPAKVIFRLNHLRIVRKRCPHSTFSSQATRCTAATNLAYLTVSSMRIECNKLK